MPTVLEACEGDDPQILLIHRHFLTSKSYTLIGEDVNDAFSGLVRDHLLNDKRVVDYAADYLADSNDSCIESLAVQKLVGDNAQRPALERQAQDQLSNELSKDPARI